MAVPSAANSLVLGHPFVVRSVRVGKGEHGICRRKTCPGDVAFVFKLAEIFIVSIRDVEVCRSILCDRFCLIIVTRYSKGITCNLCIFVICFDKSFPVESSFKLIFAIRKFR